jgi:hypothetical protein
MCTLTIPRLRKYQKTNLNPVTYRRLKLYPQAFCIHDNGEKSKTVIFNFALYIIKAQLLLFEARLAQL